MRKCEVLLLTWSNIREAKWQCIELFSGEGNLSRAFRQAGRRVASFDINLGGKSMDMRTEAGFLPPPQIYTYVHAIMCTPILRLALWLVMCAGLPSMPLEPSL